MALKRVQDNFEFGVYMWMLPNGTLFHDGDQRFLCVSGRKGDREIMKKLALAAKFYGVFDGGKFYFEPGARKITSTEYSEQIARARAGEQADQQELGILVDDVKTADVRRKE